MGIYISLQWLFTIYKKFLENPVGKYKWDTPFWVVPAENFQEQRDISKLKVVLFSGQNIPSKNFCSISVPSLIDTSFRPWWSFSGKWNWFVQKVIKAPFQDEIYQSWILRPLA